MRFVTRSLARAIAMLLICALVAASAPVAEARPLTSEMVHARIVKQGMGNWIGVELRNGTASAGRIVSIGEQSFGLQLHNDPGITLVMYSDVMRLHTGIPHGAYFTVVAIAIGGVILFAVIGFAEVHKHAHMPAMPGQPAAPLFP
jgi:hypothetical protein